MNPLLNNKMPEINMDQMALVLNQDQMAIVEQIVFKKKDETIIRFKKPTNGIASYIWRHVIFIVSPNEKHHSIPEGADDYIPESFYKNRTEKYPYPVKMGNRRAANMGCRRNNYIREELDPIINMVIHIVAGKNAAEKRKSIFRNVLLKQAIDQSYRDMIKE